MLKRKYVILFFLVFCLAATLFIGVTTSGSQIEEDITQFLWTKTVENKDAVIAAIQPYDPWMDINDDGAINIVDIVALGLRFDTNGTPINKTALLLELQSIVGYLNEALETRVPKTGYVSVPAAAFVPPSSDVNMLNNGWSLHNDENLTELFFGSVQLPHGVNVTKVTFYWRDAWDPGDLVCRLKRYKQNEPLREMAEMWSEGAEGFGSSYNDTIAYATVDNSQYAYYLEVGIPGAPESGNGHGSYFFQYAIIEYEYPI